MSYFPNHLLAELLSYLPMNFLSSLMDGIEDWNDIRNNKLFQRKQVSHSRLHVDRYNLLLCSTFHERGQFGGFLPRPLSLIQDTYGDVSLPTIFDNEQSIRVGRKAHPKGCVAFTSCDGLVLLTHEPRPFFAALWDPLVNLTRELPSLESQLPEDAEITYSIGYDGVDYKVVALNTSQSQLGELCTTVFVYTVRTHSWKKIVNTFPLCYPLYLPGIHISGKVYFWVSDSSGLNELLVLFCLTEENWLEILLPAGILPADVMDINELGGYLCLLTSPGPLSRILVLKDDGWNVLYSIPSIQYGGPGIPPGYMGILCICNGKVLLRSQQNKLIVFNAQDATLRTVLVEGFNNTNVSQFCMYLQSFMHYNLLLN